MLVNLYVCLMNFFFFSPPVYPRVGEQVLVDPGGSSEVATPRTVIDSRGPDESDVCQYVSPDPWSFLLFGGGICLCMCFI